MDQNLAGTVSRGALAPHGTVVEYTGEGGRTTKELIQQMIAKAKEVRQDHYICFWQLF